MIENATAAAHTAVPDTVKSALAAARERFSRLRGGALLIGVEAYRAHDETGGKDLPAGRNDVLAFWKVCRRLGFTHIRALTSPALTEDELVRAELELVPELSPGETADQVRTRVKRWLSTGAAEQTPEITGKSTEEVAVAIERWLASLREQPEGDVSVVLREATSSELKESVRWLARGLVTRVRLSWGDVRLDEAWTSLPGIMTFSGHGAQRDGDLVLCPTDTGPALENAVSFSELRGVFDEAGDAASGKHPTDNLTVVLDCCFAGSSEPTRKAERATTLTPAGSSSRRAPAAKKEIGSRVFCASGRDEPSYQAMLGGHWHGAFTWAITVALEQWGIKEDGQFKRSTMSHTELLFRSRMLLQALSFQQQPILINDLGNMPVFHHGPAHGVATSARPDADRPGGQLDPSTKNPNSYVEYTMRDPQTRALLATILVTNTYAPDGWAQNTEFWKIEGTGFNSVAYAAGIAVTRTEKAWAGGPSFPRAEASFRCPVYTSQQWGFYTHYTYFQVSPAQGSWQCGFLIDVAKQDGKWSGSVWWAKPQSVSNSVFTLGGNTARQDFKNMSTPAWGTNTLDT